MRTVSSIMTINHSPFVGSARQIGATNHHPWAGFSEATRNTIGPASRIILRDWTALFSLPTKNWNQERRQGEERSTESVQDGGHRHHRSEEHEGRRPPEAPHRHGPQPQGQQAGACGEAREHPPGAHGLWRRHLQHPIPCPFCPFRNPPARLCPPPPSPPLPLPS